MGDGAHLHWLCTWMLTFRRERFVCVEPGHVRGFATIEPGKTWIGQQVISVIHHERRINQL